MHLITFHRVLIVTAAVFFLGYGLWELAAFGRVGGTLRLALGLGGLTAGIALLWYLRRLKRFLRLPD